MCRLRCAMSIRCDSYRIENYGWCDAGATESWLVRLRQWHARKYRNGANTARSPLRGCRVVARKCPSIRMPSCPTTYIVYINIYTKYTYHRHPFYLQFLAAYTHTQSHVKHIEMMGADRHRATLILYKSQMGATIYIYTKTCVFFFHCFVLYHTLRRRIDIWLNSMAKKGYATYGKDGMCRHSIWPPHHTQSHLGDTALWWHPALIGGHIGQYRYTRIVDEPPSNIVYPIL